MSDPVIAFAQEKFGDIVAIANLYTMNMVWATEAFAGPLQYTPREMIGMSARDIMALQYTDVISLAAILSAAEKKEDSKKMKKKDGTIVNTRAVLSAFTFEGERYVAVHSIEFLGR